MMHLPLPWIFTLPLAASLLFILACGVYYGWSLGVDGRKKRPTQIYRCSVCRHVYVDSRDLPLARCPRCSCLNEAIRR